MVDMKSVVLLLFSLVGAGALASDIYTFKNSDGDTMLSNRQPDEKKFTEIKKIKIDNSAYEDWRYSCSKDKFNGRKSCSLHKAYSNIMVSIFDGRYSVYIGRNHFPRTQSAIKIDNNAPIYGYEGSSNTPQKVIEQMKKGKVAYTRYKEWPCEYNQDGETDLTGFTEKYNEMLEEYKKL